MTAGAKTGAVGTQLRLTYDGWNRQAGFDANGDGDTFDSGDYKYLYDGLGRRITKFQDTASEGSNAAGSSEEYFYNEGYQILEVRIGTTAGGVKTVDVDPRERYLWDLSYVDAPAMIELDTNLDGTRDQRLWPTFDANFNTTGLLTDQGVTVERYAYTPYGERVILNGDQNYTNTGADADGAEWTVDTNGSDFGMLVGFQGLRFDAETGNWYQRARYSNPAMGAFQQRDPLGTRYQDGFNLGEMTKSNPLFWTDPFGLKTKKGPKQGVDPADNDVDPYLGLMGDAVKAWLMAKMNSDIAIAEAMCAMACKVAEKENANLDDTLRRLEELAEERRQLDEWAFDPNDFDSREEYEEATAKEWERRGKTAFSLATYRGQLEDRRRNAELRRFRANAAKDSYCNLAQRLREDKEAAERSALIMEGLDALRESENRAAGSVTSQR
jgi:RHS repeat-associated protein